MGGFKRSQIVRLHSLTNAVYNGKLAVVTSRLGDDGRHAVEVASQPQDGAVGPSMINRQVRIKPENLVLACRHCYKSDAPKLQFCGKCRMIGYCNAECQQADWQRHKVDCHSLNLLRDVTKNHLYQAACVGNLGEVQNLVQRGADVNIANSDGSTPLIIACQKGHLVVVQYLIQQGADMNNAGNEGITALHIAAYHDHLMIVQYLVDQGADANIPDTDGCTPLYSAAQEGRLSVVQCLAQHGADVNKARVHGATPLTASAHNGHLAVVQFLVQQGAEMNKATIEDVTPLRVATEQGHVAVANYLREQGAI